MIPSGEGEGQGLLYVYPSDVTKPALIPSGRAFARLTRIQRTVQSFILPFLPSILSLTNVRRKYCGFSPFDVKVNRSNGFSVGDESVKLR